MVRSGCPIKTDDPAFNELFASVDEGYKSIVNAIQEGNDIKFNEYYKNCKRWTNPEGRLYSRYIKLDNSAVVYSIIKTFEVTTQ